MYEQPKTFQSRKRNPILLFLVATVLSAILVLYFFSQTAGIYSSTVYSLRFIISGIVGIAAGIIIAVTNKQVIITIDDETFTYKKGNTVEKYPLSSFAGTYIYKSNGMSDRYIRFVMPDNKVKPLRLPFGEKDYADIVALVDTNLKTNVITQEHKEKIESTFKEEISISIPREKLCEAFARSRKTAVFFSILIAVISLAVCIVTFVMLDFWYFLAFLLLFGVIGTTLSVAVFLYGRKESINALKDTPSRVEIMPYSIAFDSVNLDASVVVKITATPPSYESTDKDYEFRKIVVTDRSGLDKVFFFGKTPKGNKNMLVEEYSEVVSALETWCFSNGIEYRLDLG